MPDPAPALPSAETQTLDRVVATIGNVAITQSDVEREYALEMLIDKGRLPETPPDAPALGEARERLIDQKLLAQEALAQGPESPEVQTLAAARLVEIRKKFPSPGALDSDLKSLGMNEQELLQVLEEQERTLEMINQRLRPAASPDPSEVQTYYRESFLPEYAKRGKGSPPPLPEVESQIREILTQQKIDQQLATWLKELRATHRVEVHSF